MTNDTKVRVQAETLAETLRADANAYHTGQIDHTEHARRNAATWSIAHAAHLTRWVGALLARGAVS